MVASAPDAPGSVICSSMARKRSLVSADMAVFRACATSSLMRRDSADGPDETAEASRTGGVELAMVVICKSGSLKPKYRQDLARGDCDPMPEIVHNLTISDVAQKKAGKGKIPRRPASPARSRFPVSERPPSERNRLYCHYRLPPSAEARRTSERNSDLYPNGSAPRAAVAISMILS